MKNKEEVKVALESGIYTFDIPIKKSELVELIYQAYRLGWNDRAGARAMEGKAPALDINI